MSQLSYVSLKDLDEQSSPPSSLLFDSDKEDAGNYESDEATSHTSSSLLPIHLVVPPIQPIIVQPVMAPSSSPSSAAQNVGDTTISASQPTSSQLDDLDTGEVLTHDQGWTTERVVAEAATSAASITLQVSDPLVEEDQASPLGSLSPKTDAVARGVSLPPVNDRDQPDDLPIRPIASPANHFEPGRHTHPDTPRPNAVTQGASISEMLARIPGAGARFSGQHRRNASLEFDHGHRWEYAGNQENEEMSNDLLASIQSHKETMLAKQ